MRVIFLSLKSLAYEIDCGGSEPVSDKRIYELCFLIPEDQNQKEKGAVTNQENKKKR